MASQKKNLNKPWSGVAGGDFDNLLSTYGYIYNETNHLPFPSITWFLFMWPKL